MTRDALVSNDFVPLRSHQRRSRLKSARRYGVYVVMHDAGESNARYCIRSHRIRSLATTVVKKRD